MPSQRSTPPAATRSVEDGGSVAAPAPTLARNVTPTPAATTATFEGRPIEIACNGLDDDGDGLVDALPPVGPNACDTGKKGACATGIAVCAGAERICVGPPPLPEVVDGIDNDCNGVVDDVPAATVRPRAALLVPKYAWSDAAPDVANVVTSLAQAGITFDRPAAGSDWASVAALDEYALAIVPGYLVGGALANGIREKLEAFVERGGVLVVFKPIGDAGQRGALELAGLRAGTRRRDVDVVQLEPAKAAPTRFVDSLEERSLGVNARGEKSGVEVWTYEPDPQANVEVLATALREGAAVGAAITRRALGRGAVYAIGHDLATFAGTRCYLNCFEPAGDAMRLFFDGALREGSQGHVAILATAPALASTALVLTHDVGTREGLFAGPWGEPGALAFAKVEKAKGVHATYNLVTNHRGGQWSAATARELCALGMCPLGIQGTMTVPNFGRLADGMIRDTEDGPWRCKEALATYDVPSLCGEILMSSQQVRAATGRAPRTWRSPRLATHPELTALLASSGIEFDSSFGIGDLPFNLPLDLASTGVQQRRFHRRPLIELPLVCDDAVDEVREGKNEHIELQPSTEASFLARWEYIFLQNKRNRSFTTIRINPRRGDDTPPENLRAKALVLDRLLESVTRVPGDAAVLSIPEVGDYWRARLDTKLDTRFAEGQYVGTLTVGKHTASGLTIEFGDSIERFDCPGCGPTRVAGNRVMLASAPTPGTKLAFTAVVRSAR